MNSKFYVSFEAARLLKEKGYDKDVRNFYDEEGLFLEIEGFYNFEYLTNEELDNNHYAAPTKSEAIDWLEGKGIMIEITIDIDECAWIFNIVDKEKFITIGHPKDGEFFINRLEAEEAAIIKALELL